MIEERTIYMLKCDKCKTVLGDYWTEAEQSERIIKATRKGKCLCELCLKVTVPNKKKQRSEKHD